MVSSIKEMAVMLSLGPQPTGTSVPGGVLPLCHSLETDVMASLPIPCWEDPKDNFKVTTSQFPDLGMYTDRTSARAKQLSLLCSMKKHEARLQCQPGGLRCQEAQRPLTIQQTPPEKVSPAGPGSDESLASASHWLRVLGKS